MIAADELFNLPLRARAVIYKYTLPVLKFAHGRFLPQDLGMSVGGKDEHGQNGQQKGETRY
jgi:hypothetical protein